MNKVKKNIKDFSIGQSSSIARVFTEKDVKLFIELTGDDNAVYSCDLRTKDLKGPIVPGLLTEGLIMEVMSKKLLGTTGLMLQKDMVFNHPVYIGDTITAKVEIIDIDVKRSWVTMMTRCMNQDGELVITGQVVGLIITNIDG
ncbi:MaoC/PaaZ C-terminal domain-containing protein [Anaerobacillus sp. MEB173]|uniref:MaoC/PaaZ C-terminal domain-containing protein n=1 Tax=Anaerobacillus sp. MEB173 TaxID=3383345 RepID=UPI003F917152